MRTNTSVVRKVFLLRSSMMFSLKLCAFRTLWIEYSNRRKFVRLILFIMKPYNIAYRNHSWQSTHLSRYCSDMQPTIQFDFVTSGTAMKENSRDWSSRINTGKDHTEINDRRGPKGVHYTLCSKNSSDWSSRIYYKSWWKFYDDNNLDPGPKPLRKLQESTLEWGLKPEAYPICKILREQRGHAVPHWKTKLDPVYIRTQCLPHSPIRTSSVAKNCSLFLGDIVRLRSSVRGFKIYLSER